MRDSERAGNNPPIADYAIVSNCHGAALVSRAGSIDWLCLPRFDSPAIFARLLGTDAGHWRIAPVAPAAVERAYVDETMVLRTVFRTATGAVALTDALALGADERGHRIGQHARPVFLRRVEGLEGEVEVAVRLAPRPEYGLTTPLLVADGDGIRSHGGPVACVASGDVPLRVEGSDALARVRVAAGERHHLALQVCSPWREAPRPFTGEEAGEMLDATIAGWCSWSAIHHGYRGPYARLVRHSARVLQALTYAPTGAIIAAPTASLPETLGGERNWDYRFCWIRDASLTLEALWVAACPDEAGDFFNFVATAGGGRIPEGQHLQILYGVGGERLTPEHEFTHLPGYRGSAPVRIGNGAWEQVQIDVYGEVLSAAALLAEEVGSFDQVTAQFLVDVAETAAACWTQADHGIWEIREEPRHYVYSKLMCWVALDRAVRLAPLLSAEDRVERWSAVCREIREAIEQDGWSEQAQTFVQAFDNDALDASNLMLLITGFLPPDDERMRATVYAIAERLTDDRGFVCRYRRDDGLAGDEGTFGICTFWLAQCLAEMGEVGRARKCFERIAACANDVGLLSEEIDDASGELLGNFPQAFTHIGLVNAAWAIARAEGAPRGGPPDERGPT